VTVATTGSPPDPNGYQVTLDGGTGQHVDADGILRVNDVPVGSHAVGLGDVATNCSVSGGPSRQVAVTTGSITDVRFVVTCSQTGGGSGSIVVTAQTTGSDIDPDGYTILVNGDALASVPASGQQTIPGLTPGDYVVQLDGVAGNCQIDGTNGRRVTVLDGQSSPVNYSITCDALPPETGSIRVSTTTSGSDQDSGYEFTVDGGSSTTIGANDAATVDNLAPGQHTVVLSGVADNCSVEGGTSQEVTVSSGTTADASFNINCSATTGTIQVNVSTSGDQPDNDGYTVRLDGSNPKAIDAGESESVSYTDVPVGDHEVTISNVNGNCTVAEGTSQPAPVTAGETKQISFNVSCAPQQAQTGSLQIRTSTDGEDQDSDGYDLALDDGPARHIGPSDAITIGDVAPGNHTVGLSGIAGNCSVDANPKSVDVMAGETNDLAFAISCVALSGSVAVAVSTAAQ
jgi:hypothetical protein